jgi:hypothetical protein
MTPTPSHPAHRSHFKTFIYQNKVTLTLFLIFLFLIISAFYTTYKEGFNLPITGLVSISNPDAPGDDLDTKIKINADLDVPNLKISTENSEVEIITGTSNTVLHAGSEKFDLNKVGESSITLSSFNGKIEFDSESIISLNGRATETLINSIKTTPSSGETMKIKVSEDFSYKTLSIKETSFKSLNYITSGEIKLNGAKASLHLTNDFLDLSDFTGDISVESNTLHLDGEINKLKIGGELNINIE